MLNGEASSDPTVAGFRTYIPRGQTARVARVLSTFTGPVVNPLYFEPNLEKTFHRNPSQKVMHMDGTRYLALINGRPTLDFDITPAPGLFSSFADSGPYFHRSTPYGRVFATSPLNIRLSYRHDKKLNASFFDGSVRTIDADTSYRRADFFVPSGSRFSGGGETTPEALTEFASFVSTNRFNFKEMP
jgi:prepilin-type processing-associated H-X9-DG protein